MIYTSKEIREDIKRRVEYYYKECQENNRLGIINFRDATRVGYLCEEDFNEDVNELFWKEFKKLEELDANK